MIGVVVVSGAMDLIGAGVETDGVLGRLRETGVEVGRLVVLVLQGVLDHQGVEDRDPQEDGLDLL